MKHCRTLKKKNAAMKAKAGGIKTKSLYTESIRAAIGSRGYGLSAGQLNTIEGIMRDLHSNRVLDGHA